MASPSSALGSLFLLAEQALNDPELAPGHEEDAAAAASATSDAASNNNPRSTVRCRKVTLSASGASAALGMPPPPPLTQIHSIQSAVISKAVPCHHVGFAEMEGEGVNNNSGTLLVSLRPLQQQPILRPPPRLARPHGVPGSVSTISRNPITVHSECHPSVKSNPIVEMNSAHSATRCTTLHDTAGWVAAPSIGAAASTATHSSDSAVQPNNKNFLRGRGKGKRGRDSSDAIHQSEPIHQNRSKRVAADNPPHDGKVEKKGMVEMTRNKSRKSQTFIQDDSLNSVHARTQNVEEAKSTKNVIATSLTGPDRRSRQRPQKQTQSRQQRLYKKSIPGKLQAAVTINVTEEEEEGNSSGSELLLPPEEEKVGARNVESLSISQQIMEPLVKGGCPLTVVGVYGSLSDYRKAKRKTNVTGDRGEQDNSTTPQKVSSSNILILNRDKDHRRQSPVAQKSGNVILDCSHSSDCDQTGKADMQSNRTLSESLTKLDAEKPCQEIVGTDDSDMQLAEDTVNQVSESIVSLTSDASAQELPKVPTPFRNEPREANYSAIPNVIQLTDESICQVCPNPTSQPHISIANVNEEATEILSQNINQVSGLKDSATPEYLTLDISSPETTQPLNSQSNSTSEELSSDQRVKALRSSMAEELTGSGDGKILTPSNTAIASSLETRKSPRLSASSTPIAGRDWAKAIADETIVKKFFEKNRCWFKGVIEKYGDRKRATRCRVRFDCNSARANHDDDSQDDILLEVDDRELLMKMIQLGKVEQGTRLAVYGTSEDSYLPATVLQERMKNSKAFFLRYDTGKHEWVNLWCHDFQLLDDHEVPRPKRKRRAVEIFSYDEKDWLTRQNRSKPQETDAGNNARKKRRSGNDSSVNEIDLITDSAKSSSGRSKRRDYTNQIDLVSVTSSINSKSTNETGLGSRKRRTLQKAPARTSSDAACVRSVKYSDENRNEDTGDKESIGVAIGSRVAVYWSGEQKFYEGTVTNRREAKKPFYIEYDDGDKEWIDFSKHVFKLLNKSPPNSDKPKKSPTQNQGFESNPADVAKVTIGTRVAVWWPEDRKYYNGVVTRKQPEAHWKPFFLQYDDGDEEWIDFRHHRFRILSSARKDSFEPPNGKRGGCCADISQVSIGSRLSVWWPQEKEFFDCTVTRNRDHKRSFYLEYDDGDREWVDLKEEKFFMLSQSPRTRRRTTAPER